jgi:asparagine synthase (glutamine-hydrolysing)
MCGICGIVDFSGAPIDPARIERMTNALAHRGPDDAGMYCRENVGLGHRRLAILDLSPTGHQPMSNSEGTIWIVFNGEIYNFRELKAELIDAGHHFQSSSDTEVILHGYEEWNDAIWEKLDGMFALALWDGGRRQLLLVRDAFAVKPLYYSLQNERVIFASEIKGILAAGLIERSLNYQALSNYLSYFYTPGPETILSSVHQVRPGRIMRFEQGGATERRYWQLRVDDSVARKSEDDLLEMLRTEAREAVRKSLVSDVPVGLLLSSGLDSNIILTELLELNYPDIQTVTVGFRDDSYNEANRVKKRLDGLDLRSHIVYLEDQDIPALFDKMVYHMDSLNANVASIAEYLIVKSVAQYVKVALAGAGNDELFAGYSTYIADRIRPYYLRLPRAVRSSLQAMAQHMPQTERKYSVDYLLRKFTEGAGYSAQKSHYWWRTIMTDSDKEMLFSGPVAEEGLQDSFLVYKEYYDEAEQMFDFDTQSLYADFFMFCNENANMMVDNLSMAVSLEIRPPFLTKRFVEFAFSMPYRFKLNGTTTKYCLRRAYASRLPGYIAKQRKTGLVSPISKLIRGQLREMTCDNFAGAGKYPCFNQPYLQRILAEHLSGKRDYGFQIYVLLTFMRWHELFLNPGGHRD